MAYDYVKWLVPKKGLVVRDPRTKAPIPEIGMNKPWTGAEGRYWRRRVKCGDAFIGNQPKKVIIKKVVEKKKEK